MKKVVLSLFLAILSISLISAADISLSKSSYYPGETLQAEISGNFIDNPSLANIGIYKINQVHETPVDSGLVNYQGKYLYYALLPMENASYSIKIENARYYDSSGIQTSTTIIKNFNIIRTNSSYLSFSPGVISTTKDFSVRIKAYNQEQPVNIEFPETGQKESFNLGNGNEKTAYFSIAGITAFTKSSIKINSYSLTALITPPAAPPIIENQTNLTEENISMADLADIFPKEIDAVILANSDYPFYILLSNKTNQTAKSISIASSDSRIKTSANNIENFSGSYTFNLTINSNESFNGSIKFGYGNSSIIIPVNITVTENESSVNYTQIPIVEEKTCVESGGIKCDSSKNEECTGTQTYTKDGICCMASCSAPEKSLGWIWGIVILIILSAAGYFIYKKQKKVPGEEKAGEILKQRAEEYKERINPPEEESTEVKKSLSKN